MYGIGYGLSKMMEGATGGAVKGTMANMALNQQEKDREATQAYREKTLEQGQQRIDNEQERFEIKRDVDAFRISYDIAKDSPDPNAVFMSIYKKLNPEGDHPEVSFGEKDMEINFKGLNIIGSQEHIRQALDIISRQPEITPQVFQKLAELGLAKITVPKAEAKKGFAVISPGQGVMSKDTGEIKIEPDAEKKAKAEGKTVKVSDINTALNALFKKYKVDAGLGINVTPDGKYTVDMAAFMAGKETAYNIIKQQADAGDPEAKQDLEKINEYYRLMDGLIRGSQGPGPSLNKMIPAGAGNAASANGKKKAVYDPSTGRFTYK